MTQTSITTRLPVPVATQTQTQSASQARIQTTPQNKKPSETDPISHPRPAHTQSTPTLPAHAPTPSSARKPQALNSQRPDVSVSGSPIYTGVPGRPAVTRGYTAHLPHNPNRPPPYTYQRQHEFPPFPPLAQHPVLPFLTTAFSTQAESYAVTPAPQKARPTIAPRASTTQRHVQSHLSTIPTMDVSKLDPTATFIHPPLLVPVPRNADATVGPLSGLATDSEPAPGTPLTYGILHTHRNWFLDAEDFSKDNPNRIDYPPELEPPRGWAPLSECTGAGAANRCRQAKETKERTNAIRTKGSYAHADKTPDTTVEYGPSEDCHEKTVLRCTFCRREYHGPNAKSMWRRHVYDKHKVAMKNRREGSAGMAPKVPPPKKGRSRGLGPSQGPPLPLGPPVGLDIPPLTLDLSNEQNLIRLLERVVSGNLDISLPASLLNPGSSSDGGTPALNFQSIALALQRSGISLTLEKGTASSSVSEPPSSQDSEIADPRDAERQLESVQFSADSTVSAIENEPPSPTHTDPNISAAKNIAHAIWANESPESSTSDTFPNHRMMSASPPLQADVAPQGQKRKAEGADRDEQAHTTTDRAPLKDNTALDRNNHNSKARATPRTPRKDKGKQKALPRTPGAPRMSHAISPVTSPSRRNPYTPMRHPSTTALRARALATTGQESYLTLVLSSPATTSPVRSTGRVSFTSPFHRQTSPMKTKDRGCPPPSDDALGVLGVSSPRYPFDFNLEGTPNSPSYMTAFDPIPLELTPAHWTPPALGPPAPVSEPTSRTVSRASSVGDDIDADEEVGTDEDDQDMELQYPEWSSPSPSERSQRHHSGLRDEDFDMDAFLDLEDAGPAYGSNLTSSPHKTIVGRGFSKEFGLLSPEEEERITASARPTFENEARSSKRRRVGSSSP